LLTRGGNFGTSALVSLGFYVFYWAALIGGEKLADRGYISPAVGMWWGNAVVALLALNVFVRVQREAWSWSRFRR
jgi:lipopolysaccharide export system permease protein